MTADDILSMFRSRGLVLEARGDTLHVEAPNGVLTSELKEQLSRHKPELIARLMALRSFVTLRNGPTLPLEAIELALELERRGFRQSVDDCGNYQIEPATKLTGYDRQSIARWRSQLANRATFDEPVEP